MSWLLVCALVLGTFAVRATGLVLLGGRSMSPTLERALALSPMAIIGGLIVIGTLDGESAGLTLDARAVGLGAGLLAVTLRASFIVVFVVVVAVTIGVRSLT